MNSGMFTHNFRSTSPPPRYTPSPGISAIILLRMIYRSDCQLLFSYRDGMFHSHGSHGVMGESGQIEGGLLVSKLEVELLLRKLLLHGHQIAHKTTQLLRIKLGDVLNNDQIVSAHHHLRLTPTCCSWGFLPLRSKPCSPESQICRDTQQGISGTF